jgi:uncharacterized protein YjiK
MTTSKRQRALLAAIATIAASPASYAVGSVDLNSYQLVARYALPEPTRVTPPAGSLLAQEASAVTWNRDTNTLFVVGDGSTSIVQVSLTGQLINSMTLGKDPSKPQGTAYYDVEGLAYVGNGKFVLVEERDRIVSQFTYVPNTTLNYADSQHVKLGTTVGNIGIEGISLDPLTGGFIAVKEKQPIGIFQTTIDFASGTASNGSASTVNSLNLFDPTKTALLDIADVFALSNIAGIGAADQGNLLLLSQESGKLIKTDRSGNILGSLTIPLLPGVPGTTQLGVLDQQHEGITMDDNGVIYVVAENGGGDINNPELWVYAPVPEPGPLSLMLAGLGAIGFVVGRRSVKPVQ